MEAQTTTKPKWTALRLFQIGFGFLCYSLVGFILAVILWWLSAWDWDADKVSTSEYFFLGFGIIAALGVIASTVVMIASGVMAMLSYRKSAARATKPDNC